MVSDVKSNLRSYFSVGPKFSFVVVLLILTLSITIFSLKKTIIVSIDGKETKIVTYSRSLKAALQRNGIMIEAKDKISPDLESRLTDKEKVYIRKAVDLEVDVDGKQLKIASAEDDVEDMLNSEGIELNEFDKVTPLKTDKINKGTKVQITRVNSQLQKETLPVDFSTVIQKDDNMEKTESKIVQEGQIGEREVTTRVVLENGKEKTRDIISDIIKKQPIQKILLQGTLSALNLSRGGAKVLYTKAINCRATAYFAGAISTGKSPGMPGYGITASGALAVRNPDGYSTIAVDPRVIPIGTRVYVEGYGLAIAQDTGGAIQGNTIDVFFNTQSECQNWGAKYINVYILK